MERDMLNDMGTNLLAKAYSVEFLRYLPCCIRNICTGCQHNRISPSDHYVCAGNIPDQLYYASELLPSMINEQKVTGLFTHFIKELRLPVSSFPEEMFDHDARRAYLDDPDFWDLIASYAIPWAEPPMEYYINSDPNTGAHIDSP